MSEVVCTRSVIGTAKRSRNTSSIADERMRPTAQKDASRRMSQPARSAGAELKWEAGQAASLAVPQLASETSVGGPGSTMAYARRPQTAQISARFSQTRGRESKPYCLAATDSRCPVCRVESREVGRGAEGHVRQRALSGSRQRS
jgi:hypothetical protein